VFNDLAFLCYQRRRCLTSITCCIQYHFTSSSLGPLVFSSFCHSFILARARGFTFSLMRFCDCHHRDSFVVFGWRSSKYSTRCIVSYTKHHIRHHHHTVINNYLLLAMFYLLFAAAATLTILTLPAMHYQEFDNCAIKLF
jgi:hypothetical protein